MAAEAEAAREARAKVIAAEGEQKAARALREASEVIGDSPAALQLRYLQDVRLPVQLQRAMAAEAEAAREARAKVIAAEGEQKAARALREASEVICDSPAALQLRYLQVNL
ncbi:unnamed protein product [Pieris brassicae]|uniref:Uncharacterized protein n=1 Tax=Pieris brassicae TaxID=7116 RepID=A0A9P0U3E3_PIEBR|nr:unnamed protein product [Pieris brassicae]